MPAITRLQVLSLREKGIITPERATDWLSVIQKGGVMDVSQSFIDQAGPSESLLPPGVSSLGNNEVEIDFKKINRQGILELRSGGLITAEQSVDFLRRQRETVARPTSLGGQLVSAARFAFDPTDPRGMIEVGGVPAKGGLLAAGLGLAAGTLAASVPQAAGISATAIPAAASRAVQGVAGRVASATGVRPFNLGRAALTTAVGAGTGLATAAAIGGDDAPPPAPGEIPGEAPPTAEEVAAQAFQDALDQGGDTTSAARAGQEAAGVLGADVRYITRKVQRFNPGTGRIEEVDAIIPIVSETTIDPVTGEQQIIESAGQPFFPALAEAQFNLQQQESQRRDFTESLPSLTEFFSLLADPKTANLLRISSARARGQSTVPGLVLPEQLGALFGLQAGAELPTGIDTGRAVTSKPGGFLGIVDQLLGATGPELESQITPGSLEGFNPEQIGALEAALIGSGTNLPEQRQRARTSTVGSRSPFRTRTR